MKHTPAAIARFDRLCGGLFDGTLNEAEARELNDMLEHGWLDEYEALAEVHGTMAWQMRHQVAPPSLPRGDAVSRPARAWKPFAAAAAIVLGIGVLMSLLMSHAWDRHEKLTRPVQHFATLIDARDAVFEKSDVPTSPGSQLPGGFLRLASGEVDIEFFSGAQLTITGPASFGINAQMRGFLEHGKLSAYCPPQAKGFTIGAPGVAVVDLGTRFTMEVSESGESTVAVLEGRVRLDETDGSGNVRASRELDMHQVASIDKARRLAVRASQGLPLATAARYVHWSFDGDGLGRIPDHGSGFEGGPFDIPLSGDGAAGPRFVDGPIGKALALDGRTPLSTNFPGIAGTRARTVAAWVRVPPDARVPQSRGILSWGDPTVAGGMWQMSWNYHTPDGAAGTFGTPRLTVDGDSVITGTTSLRDGQWHHIAIVLDEADAPTIERDIRLYVDGRPEAVSRVTPSPIDTRIGVNPVRLGWDLTSGRVVNPVAAPSFRGAIDEVYIIEGALDDQQIRVLYENAALQTPRN